MKSAQKFWERQKWLVIYNALVDPRPAAAIAQHTGVSVGTVHKVISQYNRKGSAALETPGKGGRRNCNLTLEQEKEFLAAFFEKATRGQIATTTEIKLAYEKLVGHTVHKTTIYRLLDRHEWRKIVPRPCHIKAEPEEQEAFKKTSTTQVEQILETRDPNDTRPVLIMAADEGRFGRLGEVQACWCPPGIRPVVPKQQVREYVYAYAAVAPQLGQMTTLVLPYANTKMMNLFLKQVSEDFANYFIVMQVDKAAWHCSKSLQIPENIRIKAPTQS